MPDKRVRSKNLFNFRLASVVDADIQVKYDYGYDIENGDDKRGNGTQI